MPDLKMNYTSSAGIVPTSVHEYMERNFLPRILDNRVYGRDMQTRNLPPHNGKRVVFNVMDPFGIDPTPLKEGVTPDGQEIFTSTLSATVKPYGKYVALTDEIDWSLIDSFKREVSLRLGDQARGVLEAIDRHAMGCGVNVQYVGQTSRDALTSANILTYAEIKKAVRTLSKNKCEPFDDGFYHAIIGPETKFDLMSDPMWMDIAKYQDSSNLEKGEVGRMYKVKFFESTDPMVFKKETYLFGTVASLATTGYDADKKMLTVAATSVSADKNAQDLEYFVRCMSGKMVCVGADKHHALIDRVVVDGSAVKIYLRWIEAGYSHSSGATIVPTGAGASDVEVHGTIVYGKDFAGSVSLNGTGKNIHMIIKPVGSSGTDDPLDQRSTMGWKVKGYTATILQDAFGVRIEHAVSA